MILIKFLVVEIVFVMLMMFQAATNFFTELPAILMSAATLFTAIGAFIVSLRTMRKVEIVHKATNSMKDELVAVTRKDALAEGKLEGKVEVLEKLTEKHI